MGGKGAKGDETNGCAENSGDPQHKRSKRWVAVLGPLFGLATATITVIYRGSWLGTDELTEIALWLYLGLAVGWVCRSVIHGCIGYFRRTDAKGVRAYVLPLISGVDAAFAIAWLCVAILLLIVGSGPTATAAAAAASCLISFLLALATHLAAKKAGRPRASERVRARLRDPLDPGKNTPIGWPLVKLIDWRSPPHLLSTYVAGSLGILLFVLALTASAARWDKTEVEPESTQADAQTLQADTADTHVAKASHPKVTGDLSRAMAVSEIGASRKAVDLLCFPLRANHSARPAARQVTFFCLIVSNDEVTDELLVLTPSSPR